jgi:hypothetical protein
LIAGKVMIDFNKFFNRSKLNIHIMQYINSYKINEYNISSSNVLYKLNWKFLVRGQIYFVIFKRSFLELKKIAYSFREV